jgi:hypothetical protein
MTDIIKPLQEKYIITANQIEYQIQQLDIVGTIIDRKSILKELKNLVKKLEDNVW